MKQFTVEETNLISIYHTGTRGAAIKEMTALLPLMEDDIWELALFTLSKLEALTDEEYLQLAFDPADEQDG